MKTNYVNNIVIYPFILFTMMVISGSVGCRAQSEPQWRAIIAFTDTEKVSEDWNWFYADIKNACEKKGILVIHAGPQDKRVAIGPADEPFTVIDISDYFKHGKGYLFVVKGKEMEYQKYDQSFIVLKKAAGYFGVSLDE